MAASAAMKTKAQTRPQAKVLKAVSLREQVYEHLRARIHEGQLTFEDRLVDVDIADEFGVSRMPVREVVFLFSRPEPAREHRTMVDDAFMAEADALVNGTAAIA